MYNIASAYTFSTITTVRSFSLPYCELCQTCINFLYISVSVFYIGNGSNYFDYSLKIVSIIHVMISEEYLKCVIDDI